MLTNHEIIRDQVQRINKKLNLNLEIHINEEQEYFLTCEKDVFDGMETPKNEEWMIDYLSGIEDAVDYMRKLRKL